MERNHHCHSSGKLFVVGIGPGSKEDRTYRAVSAIEQCEIVIGYKTYLAHIADLLVDKEVIASGMRKEVQRAQTAIQFAKEGKRVALISSGDPGIYGMAGLALEVAQAQEVKIDVEIVPGVPAANAASSRLGAPLMLDYATISLSDLLIPWENIKIRLQAAAAADFVTVLYNPKSIERHWQIAEAKAIFSEYRLGTTPVGICTALGSDNETVVLSDLDHFLEEEINMRSIVVIGNSTTKRWDSLLSTPRGYRR